MKRTKLILLTAILFFSMMSVSSQIKIICIGNSITQGTLDTAYLNKYSYPILKSWRYPFWVSLDSLNTLKFDLIGSQNKLHKQGDTAAHYPKSKYTSRVFDSAHEARWGANSDSIVKTLKANMNKDTADIALIHIGGSDNDTLVAKTRDNIDSVIKILREKNPYTAIFLAKVVAGGAINDSIAALAVKRDQISSPIYVVDLSTGWNKATMALDTIVPDSTGEKIIAQKFFNAIMFKDYPTTTISPSGLTLTAKTIHTLRIIWKKSITASPDIFSGYNLYVNTVKVNKYLIKDTFFLIQNLTILTEYNIKVSTVDYRINSEKSSSTQKYMTAGYKVSFKILYNGIPIKDAKVSFNSANAYTDVNGTVVFTDVQAGLRQYTILKTGFFDINSTQQNIQSDTSFTVNLKSISLDDEAANIELYPVPTTGLITIKGAQGAVAEISDMQGRVVSVVYCSDAETTCDLGSMESGTYIIRIKKNDNETIRKIILIK
jgi:hypothetical protein